MRFRYNDGGRKAAGFKGTADDCACRALAIATELSYKEAYDLINDYGKRERLTAKRRKRSTARTGVYNDTFKKIMSSLGWTWVSTMAIGSGCQVHLKEDELPGGVIICNVSRHYTTVINGEINDTFDPSREGSRCVYGYFKR